MINLINDALSGEAHRKEYHQILYDSVIAINAQMIIDLGTFNGSSAEALAQAANKTGGKVYTVDIHGENDPVGDDFYIKIAKGRLKNRNNVEFIVGDSVTIGESWDKGDVDIVFCDSDHSYIHVMGELRAWEKHNPKVFFIHDIYGPGSTLGSPYYAMKDYAEEKGKQFLNVGDGPGLGIILMQ